MASARSGADENTFASGEAVSFDYDRNIFAGTEICQRSFGIGKCFELGRLHISLAEQVLAKDFAPFEFGSHFTRTKDAELFFLQRPQDRVPAAPLAQQR